MTPIARPDIDAVERLHTATGNYRWFYHGVDENGVALVWHSSGVELVEFDTTQIETAASDAEFIALAHEQTPGLIAYIRHLEAERDRLQSVVDEALKATPTVEPDNGDDHLTEFDYGWEQGRWGIGELIRRSLRRAD